MTLSPNFKDGEIEAFEYRSSGMGSVLRGGERGEWWLILTRINQMDLAGCGPRSWAILELLTDE